ncbi:MAG TPA: 5-methyltetrahydropteroyltriglutamate--homocysteine S-methyltransferase [Candidatus Binataceae bacterium]|nr:5-methyltetrahydropteroyltriglutamate--homocysteine S-methyltransferase [Candidatus Binataceae bacterium]
MTRDTPPFRAEQVGSLLRSERLKQARAQFQESEITFDRLKEVEDREIETLIRRQEGSGLRAITDGEYRRSWWHFDFLWQLNGCERVVSEQGISFSGVTSKAAGIRIDGKLDFPEDHPMLAHFEFLRTHTQRTPKMTIPSPAMLYVRTGRELIDQGVYPDLENFFDDLAETYRKAVAAFYQAGCRYLQFDDTAWAFLCSKEQRGKAQARGENLEKLGATYARAVNFAVAGKPPDMVITGHVCRGNFRSSWISEGGYEPVAELLLGGVDYDGYFLEYDSERAGGFEPLRFLPKGKKLVVLGLVTSKSGELEKPDFIKRKIEEAAKYTDLAQLCLSPQCGFASTEEGNLLSEDEQWAKLRLVVDVAREVWG